MAYHYEENTSAAALTDEFRDLYHNQRRTCAVLEKTIHDLRVEVSRLRAEIATLKASEQQPFNVG